MIGFAQAKHQADQYDKNNSMYLEIPSLDGLLNKLVGRRRRTLTKTSDILQYLAEHLGLIIKDDVYIWVIFDSSRLLNYFLSCYQK